MRFILKELARVYGWVSSARNDLYDRGVLQQRRANLPIICVGNLTAGGNSKTPLCLFLVKELKEHGRRPVILSRGYGGSESGPTLVTPLHTPAQVGDEPFLMARTLDLPVVVARSRFEGSQFIYEQALGDLVVLDDGFQHRSLWRNLNIVTIDVSSEDSVQAFVRGELLPLGRFREERDVAFKRADIIVLSERRVVRGELSVLPENLLRILPAGIPVFRSFLESDGLKGLSGGEPLAPGPIAAFCGLGNPQGFFDSLRALGFKIENLRAFPDHHVYAGRDLQELRKRAPGLPLVCTEKDAVKIPKDEREGVYSLQVSLRIDRPAEFIQALKKNFEE